MTQHQNRNRFDHYYIVYERKGVLVHNDGILNEEEAFRKYYNATDKDPHATLTHEFKDGSELMYDWKRDEWVNPKTYIERYS